MAFHSKTASERMRYLVHANLLQLGIVTTRRIRHVESYSLGAALVKDKVDCAQLKALGPTLNMQL
jgi:hypothetical protein